MAPEPINSENRNVGGADSVPKPKSHPEEGQALSLTEHEREIGKFINLALKVSLFKEKELIETVGKYRDHPAFFSAMNTLFERFPKIEEAYELIYAVTRGSPKEAIVAGVVESKDITNIKSLLSCWQIFGRSSPFTPKEEPPHERNSNPTQYMKRIAGVCNRYNEIMPDSKLNEYKFPEIEIILDRSSEPKHDLECAANLLSGKNLKAPNLIAYYDAGHRYICHSDYFKSTDERMTISETELEVRRQLSTFNPHPNFKHLDSIVGQIAALPIESHDEIFGVVRHFTLNQQEAACINILGGVNKNLAQSAATISLIAILKTYTERDLAWASSLVESVLETYHDSPLDIENAKTLLQSKNLEELERQLYAKRLQEYQQKYPEKSLIELRRDFLTRRDDNSILPNEQLLDQSIALYQIIHAKGKDLIHVGVSTLSESVEALKQKMLSGDKDKELKLEYFALTREMFRRQFGVYPYNTQLVGILIMIAQHEENLSLPPTDQRPLGVCMQVDTGEGKSLMNAIFSSYMAFSGRNVYCGSHNSYLFERDAAKFKKFYESLGISSGVYLHRSTGPSGDPPQILYSSNPDMIFGYLSSRLNGRQFFNGKSFDLAMIDEADNLLIDQNSDSCRIAAEALPRFSDEALGIMLQFAKGNRHQIQTDLPAAVLELSIRQREVLQYRPDPIVLSAFLRSAAQADSKIEGEDFAKQKNEIVIIDPNTGRLRPNFQWGLGLHEFVAINNNLQPPKHIGTVAQMSHPVFLKMFKNIFCISGTFGDATDNAELWDVYRLKRFDVPPHRPSQRKVLPTKFIANEDALTQFIVEQAISISDSGRPYMYISHTPRGAGLVHGKTVAAKRKAQLFDDINNSDQEGIKQPEEILIRNAGKKGAITIATKVASRGGDFRPENDALRAGGLHVDHDLAENARNERQMSGRSARQGEPGSSRGVFSPADKFFRDLPDPVKNTVTTIAERFGDESPELNIFLKFATRAHNIVGSVIRRGQLARETMLQDAMNAYFDRVNGTANSLNEHNSNFSRCAEYSGFLVAHHMQEEWSREFEEANILLDEHNLASPESPNSSYELTEVTREALDSALNDSLNLVEAGSEIATILFDSFESYKGYITNIERNINSLDESTAKGVVENLRGKIDEMASNCFNNLRVKSWDDILTLLGVKPKVFDFGPFLNPKIDGDGPSSSFSGPSSETMRSLGA